jgi:hypothetical protein
VKTRVILALLILLTAGLGLVPAMASSHREAPAISRMPAVDGTDFYMFSSYEAGRSGFVTLVANYIPLEDAYGGPNYFALDPDALYRILIDNTGDGVEDVTFQFHCGQTLADIKLPVGGKQVSVPLIDVGPISGGPGHPDATLNRRESCSLSVSRGRLNARSRFQAVTDANTHSASFDKPVDNIGEKTIADYASYARQFIYDIDIPGCTGAGRMFIGQRKDSFSVNLGEIFDLVNISNPLGPRDAEPDALADKNITSFILEVPSSCLVSSKSTVIGGWTTALLPRQRMLRDNPTFASPASEHGDFVQVSRLGMPLVNEIVIGLKDKNLFNAATPEGDAALATYVTNPTLPAILEILFGSAGVKAPTNFPRTDLVAAFATGVQGVNFLSDGKPHEMIRLNTATPPTPAISQNNLGLLGNDPAGFPNGRRPGDDVVDIELRVAMGVLCHAFPGVFCSPADAPSGNLPFTDGTLQDVSQFDTTFPYLRTPLPGSPNGPNGITGAPIPAP